VASKLNCLPVYILIDTSSSMKNVEAILNESVENLYDELVLNKRISEFAHVSIVSFNTNANVIMQMTDLHSMTALPEIQCGGATNFSRALRLLKEQIDLDVPALSSAGRDVLRPVVFFLTDGQPTDENGNPTTAWRADYAAIIDRSWRRHPNVVPFGYGDAAAEVLLELATIEGAAFLAKDGGTGDALRKIIPTLLNTLVASARDNELRLPAEVDGFIRVSPEIVE
jgi:uncharacterized protein YegL